MVELAYCDILVERSQGYVGISNLLKSPETGSEAEQSVWAEIDCDSMQVEAQRESCSDVWDGRKVILLSNGMNI